MNEVPHCYKCIHAGNCLLMCGSSMCKLTYSDIAVK